MSDALIRRYYACLNDRCMDDAAALFTADAVLEHPPFCQMPRGDLSHHFAVLWLHAFPDGRLAIKHVEQRGDAMCEVDLTGTGTHTRDFDLGSFGLFKATGGRVATIRFRELLEIRAGKISYSNVSLDLQDLVRQLTQAE